MSNVKLSVMARRKKWQNVNFCSKFLTFNPFGGIQHLKTHGENCARNHLGGKYPMQSQLQFQEDGSVSTWTYNSMVARESLGRLITATDLPINFSDNSFYEDHVRSYIIINLKKLVEQPLKVILLLIIIKFALH